MKTQQEIKLIIKHKKISPIELIIYSLSYTILGDNTKVFMPIHVNTMPQSYFHKSISRVTRKMKGFKLLMTNSKLRRYV